jgi:hypothetical protein
MRRGQTPADLGDLFEQPLAAEQARRGDREAFAGSVNVFGCSSACRV